MTWRCKAWLPAPVPINVLITESLQTGREYLEGGGRKGKGVDEENLLFPCVLVKRASWIVYISNNEGANWLAMEKCRR